MFTTYIKNLNDMVFSTSESPEEQSTGVLGRIGSWLSPWKGNGSKSPTGNASPTNDQAPKSEGEEESEKPVRLWAKNQEWEEEKEQSSNPNPLFLSRDISPYEEQDATQSAHRDGFIGVVWDSDRAHTQPQAHAGRKLHVYLEEISVTHSGKDTCAGQEIIRTEVTKKNLTIHQKAPSSPSFDLNLSSTSNDIKRTNVSPAKGAHSYYSALVGVSLKSPKDSEAESEEQTQANSMGRKNAARRKLRKNSQGDEGNTPQEKMPPTALPVPEGILTSDKSLTSPQGKSPETHMGESSVNSSSQPNPTPQASPEGTKSETSCPDAIKQLDDFQDSNSVIAASLACVLDRGSDMEDNDDDVVFRVERKTETPESKRRSLKVSWSEVKFFTKNVPLNPKKSPEGGTQEKRNKDEAKDKPNTEVDGRQLQLKKIDEEPKPAAGSIANKINLFESPAARVNKQTFQSPRSADVSPVRKATAKLKDDYVSLEKRSKSAEPQVMAMSGTASLVREKPMTIKERARNFTAASKSADRPAQKTAMTGMSQTSSSSVAVAASKATKLDNQGKLDAKERIDKQKSEITLKPDGQDTNAVGVKFTIPKEQLTDSDINNTVALKTAEKAMNANSLETDDPTTETCDSKELNSLCLQPKVPIRTGSRSKRRKGRESNSSISPNGENKPDISSSKAELTAKKQQVDDTGEAASASKTQEVSLASEKASGNTSDKQSLSDTKGKAFKKEIVVVEKQKERLDVPVTNENINKLDNRQEGLPEPSVNKDEPDTAAGSSGTKTPIDKSPAILPQKQEQAGGNSLSFTQRKENTSKDCKETSASSHPPVVEQPTEKTRLKKQGPSVEHPKLEKELPTQSASKSEGKVKHQNKKYPGQKPQPLNKETELINQAESKDVENLEKVEGEEMNQTEKKNKDKPQQLLRPDKNTTKAKVSDGRQFISGTEESAAVDDERINAEIKEKIQSLKVMIKPEIIKPEPAAQSSERTSTLLDLPAQKQHVINTENTHPEKPAVCDVTQTKEVVSVTKSEKRPSKGNQATFLPSELQKKSTKSPGTETEPQPHSVSVEKTENLPDDSCPHGANDSEFSSSESITKATTAAEKLAIKARDGTPALIAAQKAKKSSVKEHTPISESKSERSKGAAQDDGESNSNAISVPSEVKVSGDIIKPARRQREDLKTTESTSDITSVKGAKKIAPGPSDREASSSMVNVAENTAEKTLHSQSNDVLLVAKGDYSHQLNTVEKELVNNKPSQPPQANKPTPDTTQSSAMKKLHLPRGLNKDYASAQQDAPSSWLDVDFPKRKLKVPVPKLSSSGSESNLLDTSGELDDDDFIEKIKNLCSPFSLPPRKHNILRTPQPPFAMPAIREDRHEKTFDPEEFKFGLRKKDQFSVDTTPSLLSRLQNKDTKSGLKPARASLVDRSMLLSSLDTHSRLKDPNDKDEEDVKEEKEDQVKVKSRLEGSCVLSSLSSSIFRGKRNGAQTQVDGTSSGDVSPSEAPQLSPPLSQPSSTPSPPLKVTLAPSNREEAQAVEAVVDDSGPPLPSFNDVKLPDYLEKYFPQEPAKQGKEQVKPEVIGKMTTPASGDEADRAVKPLHAVPAFSPGIPPITPPTLPTAHTEPKQPPAQPRGTLSRNIRTVKGFHKRPGKMVLFEKAEFSGQAHEIYRDVADATSLQLSPLVSVVVVRGCWVLYEKPDFQGRCFALEEGGIELTNMWAEPSPETEPQTLPPMLIGSIRLAVRDYSLPHIDLFTEPEGRGRVTPYHDDTIETGSFGIPLSTASIQVHSGVWLLYSDPGFQGMSAVLETGVYPVPETWGFPSPFVGSLRPLKMGGFKVEHQDEVKAVVYEKPGLEGSCLAIDSDVFSFCESQADIATDGANLDSTQLKSVGSLKIIGGFWVGYSEPGFEGQQYILEEGEYLDFSDWGGSEQLLSLRPILADFMSPHLKMFSDRDFGNLGVNIDLTVPVINMEDTGYGVKTQSVDVISGVWVLFEELGFCGECYVVEKGLYGCPEDWGALKPRVASAMPVVVDDFENAAKFKVQLFSDPGFEGSVIPLENSVASLQDGVSVASCKVLAGSWLAFEGQDFTGRMYVLEVGSYPDLRAMGCVSASSSIMSLQTVGFEFSLPSITLFERSGLWGKRVVLTEGSVNLQLAGGCSRVQSVLVEGGMWILYEGINYRGPQILLKPGEVPDWRKFSSWQKIGSLRPLTQKRVHFRLRNRHSGLMMSVTGDLEEVKLLRIQETEETDGFDQIWVYHDGHLHCKLLEECCLGPSGSVTMAGSRVGLSPDTENHIHLWSITPEGFIRYTPTADLVLEVKGGQHYDKNQVILKTLDPSRPQQRWVVEVI
ncbi:beta/gamma crystallin domain-containing protein 1-like isoform X2 [Eleginops maclovinus]|uniref:beta/gamma crystallin domain-containing protein 1-like isoform X2 n=1 Tax=Eleginops maclovinus TaxID=56733 RepID=UPI00307FF074